MKTWIKLSLFFTISLLAQNSFAQVGAEGPADQQKVETAIPSADCQGLLNSFKRRVISYNSDLQTDAEVNAQIMMLMSDAQSQANTMNCAQQINMAVETVDIGDSYRARIRRRMAKIVQAIGAVVNSNTIENLRIRSPASTIGIRG